MNVKCSCGCERELNRARFKANTSGLYFLNTQHAGAYRTEVYLRDMCGDLLSVVKEYLDGYAANHYKSLTTIRRALCPLMLFLNERGILNLDRVSPKIITEYLLWAEEMEYKNASHDLTVLTGFFKWAATHGYHDTPNPVRPQFHGKRRPEYLPRPYTHAEMSLIWRLAEERGNSRTRAVISIGEEAGLRLGEICRLKVRDVDLAGRRLFVGLPNKTDCERWALFTDKTVHLLTVWLADRSKDVEHDSLFHNLQGDPMQEGTMHLELVRTLCKSYAGKFLHEEGLDVWSTHRLRHTMASSLAAGGASVSTIMAAGGWKSESSMLIYAQADPALARRGYDDAMALAKERALMVDERRTLTMDELLEEFDGRKAS